MNLPSQSTQQADREESQRKRSGRRSGRMRIGLIHRFDAQNIRSWSGIFYFMGQALQRHVGDVVYLGPDTTYSTKLMFDTIGRINRLARPAIGANLIGEANRFSAKRLASVFEPRINAHGVDVLFAPAASTEIACLKTELPIVYLSDITWKNIVDYYSDYSSFSSIGRREGELIEARAIQRANAVVYPSDWPARTAREHYQAPARKIFRIPFGANLREIPSRQEALARKFGSRLELLWIGVDWTRKGAAVAVQCVDKLLESGIDARLTICGCSPPPGFSHRQVRVFGFLDKHDPEQRKQLFGLFLEAHFFIFPTQAEAFGVVIAEASAHGLPSLVNDTGGISGALRNGVNGFLMPTNSTGHEYASKIRSILDAPGDYEKLMRSSRDLFEQELNWDAWGNSMRKIFRGVLENRTEN